MGIVKGRSTSGHFTRGRRFWTENGEQLCQYRGRVYRLADPTDDEYNALVGHGEAAPLAAAFYHVKGRFA